MTERLSALLREEAEALDVPPAPTAHELLTTGRSLRRRRRAGQVVVTVAAVAAVSLGAAFAFGDFPGRAPDDQADSPSGPPSATGAATAVDGTGLAFASGRRLYLDGGTTMVELPEIVQQIYDTSAGLLLRTNQSGNSDGGAPFHFRLVTPDGAVRDLGLTLGEVVPSTDASQAYLAYGDRADDGTVSVVVYDLTAGRVRARVDLGQDVPTGGWTAPPVALDGDLVYVGGEDTARVVDWRTGEVTTTDALPPGLPTVVGGRAVDTDGNGSRIVDVATGQTLLALDGYAYVTLSPDGHFAKVQPETATDGVDVYDLDTGSKVMVPGQAFDWGFTTDGRLFRVRAHTIDDCSAATGECTTAELPEGVTLERNQLVRLAGQVFES